MKRGFFEEGCLALVSSLQPLGQNIPHQGLTDQGRAVVEPKAKSVDAQLAEGKAHTAVVDVHLVSVEARGNSRRRG